MASFMPTTMFTNAADEIANDTDYLYGGPLLKEFSERYGEIHKPLVLVISVFGVFANIVNIIVLTRREMITPTNVLLTGLSGAQLLLLLSYISLVLYNCLREGCYSLGLFSYEWATYKTVNVTMNVAFHSTALMHTLFLAIFRFVAVKSPHLGRAIINVPTARKCSAILFGVVPILCVPTFFTVNIATTDENCCELQSCYELAYTKSEALLQLSLWSYGVLFKLVPSLTICALSFYLIKTLKLIDTKSERLTGKDNIKRKELRQRLTKMLVTVALLCVAVELPHGVFNLMTGVLGRRFGTEIYDHLGDLFEMLTLFYSSINFVLYCLMSADFKNTIRKMIFGFAGVDVDRRRPSADERRGIRVDTHTHDITLNDKMDLFGEDGHPTDV